MPVVGVGWVRDNKWEKSLGTLLGFEATPGLFWVVSLHLGGGVWCLSCG